MGPSAPTAETTQPYPVSAISVPEEPVELGQETAGSADGSASASLTPPDAEPSAETTQVASIMRSMSWGSSLHQAGGLVEPPRPSEAGQPAGQHSLVSELHARAAAQAAAAIGLSPSAAMAASHMLPDMQSTAQAALTISSMAPVQMVAAEVAAGKAAESQLLVLDDGGVLPGEEWGEPAAGEQAFTCTVCRKVFKREMNLIFHMTTRPRQPHLEESGSASAPSQPVKCQDCGKEFATKYQAKKHFLRRHFQGEKPFACLKCNKKRFVVKEDLTMHMKSCGNIYLCKCGIRLCSLGALKRHCKYFSHEPESLEPRPDPSVSRQGAPPEALEWDGGFAAGQRQQLALAAAPDAAQQLPAGALSGLDGASAFLYPTAAALKAAMAGGATFAAEGGAGPSLSSLAPPDLHGLQSLHSSLQNVSATLPSDPTLQQLLRGGPAGGAAAAFSPAAALGLAPLPGAGGGGGLGMLAQLQGASRDSQQWSPEVLHGLLPSLAQALRQAQTGAPMGGVEAVAAEPAVALEASRIAAAAAAFSAATAAASAFSAAPASAFSAAPVAAAPAPAHVAFGTGGPPAAAVAAALQLAAGDGVVASVVGTVEGIVDTREAKRPKLEA
mmetsp:Transcript_27941/g.82176  ORF Transcript_27941/g.82176 Transcript_27941/m.82176 type:complete len:612 (+) Transcript_27941:82-1917(+)